MSAENDLLNSAKAYEEGVYSSVLSAQASGQLNPTSAALLQSVSKSIPGATQALAIQQGVQAAINKTFGQGSVLARAAAAAQGGTVFSNPIHVIQALSGRTYGSDNYWAAVFFLYYVKGNSSIRDINQVGDQDVGPALEFFISKLGVFISGREHLKALQKSAQDYIALYKVNSYTTTDIDRVNKAVAVMQMYMPVDNIPTVPAGSWANVVGVYDRILINVATGQAQLVAGTPQTALQNAAVNQVSTGPTVLPGGQTVPAGTHISFTGSNILVPAILVIGGVILLIGITAALTK